MKVIVGLGNPGRQYVGTRHNVGYAVVDLLAGSPRAGRPQERFQAAIIEVAEDPEKVLLVKPLTYMNLSGQAVRQLLDYYKLEVGSLLVVCDDFNLPLGKLRLRARGTHGGHNGLRNIQEHLGTNEYGRLRVGVGAPPGEDAVDHVLGRFRSSELPVIQDAVQQAAQAAVVWVAQGIEVCMNRFNG